MQDLKLTLACNDYDRCRALFDGSVKPDGIELSVTRLKPRELFPRMLDHQEFDVAELSLASYATLVARDASPFIAIPVMLSKLFRHSCIYVRKGAGIERPQDLRGKRVGVSQIGDATIARIIEAHLALGGLTYNDVTQVPAANVVNGADDFGSGKTDVFFFATGSAKVKEIDAKVGGLRAISVENSPDAVARMQKILPGSYVMTVKPGPNLDGVHTDTNVVAFDFLLMTNKSVKDDIVYKAVKALHDNKQILVETFAAMSTFDPDQMARNYAPLEYHPGAIKAYTEMGKWPPKK